MAGAQGKRRRDRGRIAAGGAQAQGRRAGRPDFIGRGLGGRLFARQRPAIRGAERKSGCLQQIPLRRRKALAVFPNRKALDARIVDLERAAAFGADHQQGLGIVRGRRGGELPIAPFRRGLGRLLRMPGIRRAGHARAEFDFDRVGTAQRERKNVNLALLDGKGLANDLNGGFFRVFGNRDAQGAPARARIVRAAILHMRVGPAGIVLPAGGQRPGAAETAFALDAPCQIDEFAFERIVEQRLGETQTGRQRGECGEKKSDCPVQRHWHDGRLSMLRFASRSARKRAETLYGFFPGKWQLAKPFFSR
ncbi:MAG: hypothetical protein BWZ10_01556 [candidate division BRC1 bacterium ADurb.BinA364]|nr:MAG: hypothetical protein BWZ10_01556 [candidate division BRC1 bacterium ADurb.BinA364]